MKSITCHHCGAEIPAQNINPQRGPAKCPNCQAVLDLAEVKKRRPLSYPKQLDLPLPKGLTIEKTENELKISRPWVGTTSWLPLAIALLCSGGLVVGSLRLAWDTIGSVLGGVLLLIGATLVLYLVLTTLINKTTISVNPTALEIKHGPLPALVWPNRQFDATQIKSLHVEEKITSERGSTTYSYQLYVTLTPDKREALFSWLNFSEWDQVLYLEQEIERYLGLKDHPRPGEPDSPSLDPLKGERRAVWQKLAAVNRLEFVPRSPLKGAYISGLYRDCYLELDTLSKKRGDEDDIYTRLLLTMTKPLDQGEPVALAQVATILTPTSSLPNLKGTVTVETGGQKIYYEQTGVEADQTYLQFLFDAFSDLLKTYPKIITLGGEAVSSLQAILDDEKHPFQSIAPQLLAEIAHETTQRLAGQASRLRCVRCLGECVAHEVRLSLLQSLTYYGCQSCRQGQQFFEFEGQVIAVLDSQMNAAHAEQVGRLRINWLARRALFYFDTVEIIRATDEEVERLAVQVGNDTDPIRQPRYKEMPCLVWPDCRLTENTLRILERTFGRVEINQEVGERRRQD
jgi:hypothetical protein